MNTKNILRIVKWNVKEGLRLMMNLDELFWKPKNSSKDKLILNTFHNRNDIYFIQIGANDGVTADSLRKYITKNLWQGVLIEPVPYVYERLVENYKDYKGLKFENSAIGTKDGFESFYSLSEFDLNNKKLFFDYERYKIDQLGSFDKATLMKHTYMHPDFEALIREIKVPTITFNSLLTKYNISKIDLLQIDTEGYDFELLSSINFDKVFPAMLIFEHMHMKKYQHRAILKKLRKAGYRFYLDKWDTIGVIDKAFITDKQF
ncbi:MAG: FkbM family methyltransferase [Ferruginibacter sp.]